MLTNDPCIQLKLKVGFLSDSMDKPMRRVRGRPFKLGKCRLAAWTKEQDRSSTNDHSCRKFPVIKRLRRKVGSKSKSVTSVPPPRLRLFGQPPILEGEDAAAYDELVARFCAAIKPDDIIDEMYVADVVLSEWEVLRWHRLKRTLMQATALKALERFLIEQLESNYALYAEHFESHLAQIFQNNNLPKDQADSAEMLAAECAPNTAEADEKLDKLLRSIGLDTSAVLRDARARKAKELVQQYVRREPDAVTLIDEVLTAAGTSMDSFMAEALTEKLDYIERIDRLTGIAEDRRNTSLIEIERRRAVLGTTLRRSVQEIEDAEFEVIEETPAKGKNVT
jgi:hypothetical protein